MFAVIRTGGKQYKVAKNDIIRVERLADPAGEIVELNDVLMLGDGDKVTVGSPLVPGACVGAAVLEHDKGERVIIFKKKRRHNYRRKRGHRQLLTVLKITEILTGGQKPDRTPILLKAPKAADAPAPSKAPAAKKAAAKAAKPAAAKTTSEKKTAAKKAAPKKPAATKTAAKKSAKKKK